MVAADVEQLKQAKEDCKALVRENHCNPLLVRLAWHDSGNYDASNGTGGAKGTIRFNKELSHGANKGLENAVELLEPIKRKRDKVSWADLIQMASVAAIEQAGGPTIPMRYGREDRDDNEVPPEGRLPEGDPPFQKAQGDKPLEQDPKKDDAADHLRRVFYRMGLNDKDIVALSGGHTLGRAHSNRSGANRKAETGYTKDGPGTRGGQSWTEDWLKFNNRYFTMLVEEHKGMANDDLLRLATDSVLLKDDSFRSYVYKYAEDEERFFNDYKESHNKLSELGSIFNPPEGVTLD